jgi:hypothetical protein
MELEPLGGMRSINVALLTELALPSRTGEQNGSLTQLSNAITAIRQTTGLKVYLSSYETLNFLRNSAYSS